jgi:hypothetical protein
MVKVLIWILVILAAILTLGYFSPEILGWLERNKKS